MDKPTEKLLFAMYTLRGIFDASEVLRAVDRLDCPPNDLLVVTLYNSLFHTICIDWCKLFGSCKEEHHWKKLIDQDAQESFRSDLEACIQRALRDDRMGLQGVEFVALADFHRQVTSYRNKFAAHLDTYDNVSLQRYPSVKALRETALLLYSKLYTHLEGIEGVKNYPQPDQYKTENFYRNVSRFHQRLANGLE